MRKEQSTRAPAARRIATRTALAVSAALVAVFAATEVREAISTNRGGLAQSLHQSAWTKALSGDPAAEAWPWQNVSSPMSQLPSAKVRRLGLSASLRDMTEVAAEIGSSHGEGTSLASEPSVPRSTEGDIALGDLGSGTVGIGDSITFTANDGATCVYRVTGRPVVDPHLASGHAEGAKGDAGLFDCSPLDSLIMRASQKAQKTAPQGRGPEHQRKL